MNQPISNADGRTRFELRFEPLFIARRAYVFPCDASGHVDLDAMSSRIRNNYFYARSVIGREFSAPRVEACCGVC